MAMLIPSIDLMDGKIVQLVQGRRKALETEDFEGWIARFASYPLVQLIDLNAAMGTGDNRILVRFFTQRLPCQLGGGIQSVAAAEAALEAGAKRVICGSALVQQGTVNTSFAEKIAGCVGRDKLVFAVDSRQGKVSIRGWREPTEITPRQMIESLEPWCGAFLYTHIDTEGMLKGIPFHAVRELRSSTNNQLIVAGGIASIDEVERLDSIGVDAVVGMAIYKGMIKV
jgi:phosphoribosylformimino-5-aminoimidazole carboxamide ribotide isomerase